MRNMYEIGKMLGNMAHREHGHYCDYRHDEDGNVVDCDCGAHEHNRGVAMLLAELEAVVNPTND